MESGLVSIIFYVFKQAMFKSVYLVFSLVMQAENIFMKCAAFGEVKNYKNDGLNSAERPKHKS